jgi:hypothetical protein
MWFSKDEKAPQFNFCQAYHKTGCDLFCFMAANAYRTKRLIELDAPPSIVIRDLVLLADKLAAVQRLVMFHLKNR